MIRRRISIDRVARRRARSLLPPVAPTRANASAPVPMLIAGLAVAAALVHPVLGLAVAISPGVLLALRARSARRAHARSLVATMPDVIDLFRVAAGAGATVHESVVEVAAVSSGPIRNALSMVVRRTSRGDRLTAALPFLVDALGEPARPLVATLVSCERDGAALSVPLERAAIVARDVRRRGAEAAAHRVPVRLVLPLVACVLPAFVLLTVVPLLAGTLRSLGI
jgi:pilus assembly protein TadC